MKPRSFDSICESDLYGCSAAVIAAMVFNKKNSRLCWSKKIQRHAEYLCKRKVDKSWLMLSNVNDDNGDTCWIDEYTRHARGNFNHSIYDGAIRLSGKKHITMSTRKITTKGVWIEEDSKE